MEYLSKEVETMKTNSRAETTTTKNEMIFHLMGLTENWRWQEKVSMNMKIVQQKLSNMKNRGKKDRRKRKTRAPLTCGKRSLVYV